ncbi:MAG: maltotransferase domain-containing protein [Elusimicrobiota bacterium]
MNNNQAGAPKTAHRTFSAKGRQRVVIERLMPEIDAGRFPLKRTVGEKIRVTAHIFADGHEELVCNLRYRHESRPDWNVIPLQPVGNDCWSAEFTATEIGRYKFTAQAWIDPFMTWLRDLDKRLAAGQDLRVDLLIGAGRLEQTARRAAGADARRLRACAQKLRQETGSGERIRGILGPEIAELARRYPDRRRIASYGKELEAWIDRDRARCGAWYEMFPRSCAPKPGEHGTFRDCVGRLSYIADMGFDVLYLPPIHPIGRTHRKGKNNALTAGPEDPGSPWAIGSAEGGHKSIHGALGTLADFRELIEKASRCGLEVALDIALQCSPDHPYVKEHPEWFRRRPDGTIQYAENPPKKYEDIYPFDFACAQWRELWEECRSIFLFWIEQGVRIFRVDNPHTKPFEFWEWLIREIRTQHPDVLFLAEAFTRPKIMYRLAKLGFTQSYNYFPWKTGKHEIIEYFTELTQSEVREFYRPNLWTNTPDILIAYLQQGGHSAFMVRYLLASTLGASYGIYGPAFELCESSAKAEGQEEYLNSEKYQLRHWNRGDSRGIQGLIARVNGIRRALPALHNDWSLRFLAVDNDNILCYSKHAEESPNDPVVVIISLDPLRPQSGWVDLPLADFGLDENQPYQVHDLLTDARYPWRGRRNYVELRPREVPAHILRIERTPAPRGALP